jgi:hypothetical protein
MYYQIIPLEMGSIVERQVFQQKTKKLNVEKYGNLGPL